MKTKESQLRQVSLLFIRSIAVKPSIRFMTECLGVRSEIRGI